MRRSTDRVGTGPAPARKNAPVEEAGSPASTGATKAKAVQTIRIEKDGLDRAAAWATIGIFALLCLAIVYLMSAILIPITLAVVVGLILGIAADKLGKLGVPPALSGVLLSSLFAGGVFLVINALAEPVSRLAADAPAMLQHAIERITAFLEQFEWLRITAATFRNGPVSLPSLLENTGSILQLVVGNLTPALIQVLIFFASLLLFLVGRLKIRKSLIMTFRRRERRLTVIRIVNAIEEALGFYFATAALIYAGLGMVMTFIAFLGGLGVPAIWGVFAFLASFVPFLGFTAMTIALAAAGILTHDTLIVGLAPAAAFLTIHLLIENIAVPAVMGKRLEINPFIIFVAIIFWSWMWGAIGAMLALPLSLIVMTVVEELLPEERAIPQLPD